jgi:hypothetical protein
VSTSFLKLLLRKILSVRRMNLEDTEASVNLKGESGDRMGKTNPVGKDAVNVSANVPGAIHAALLRLAKESGVGISTYCRRVLIHAAQTRSLFDERTVVVVERRESASSTLERGGEQLVGDQPIVKPPPPKRS